MCTHFDHRYEYEYDFPIDLPIKGGVEFIEGHIIAKRYDEEEERRKCSIIPLATGIKVGEYDAIQHISDDLFFVKLDSSETFFDDIAAHHFGIISSKGTALCPIEYAIITIPVDGYVFAMKSDEETHMTDVFLYDLNNRVPSPIIASSNKEIYDIVSELEQGFYKIGIQKDYIGLKSISVPDPHVFDDDFIKLISDKPFANSDIETQERYWIDINAFIPNDNQSYNSFRGWDNYSGDMEDTWDAITGGAYDDMPDGWDGDMEFMGH